MEGTSPFTTRARVHRGICTLQSHSVMFVLANWSTGKAPSVPRLWALAGRYFLVCYRGYTYCIATLLGSQSSPYSILASPSSSVFRSASTYSVHNHYHHLHHHYPPFCGKSQNLLHLLLVCLLAFSICADPSFALATSQSCLVDRGIRRPSCGDLFSCVQQPPSMVSLELRLESSPAFSSRGLLCKL